MTDSLQRFARLVDTLLYKTKEGKLSWEYNHAKDEISVWNGDVVLLMVKSRDENYEDLYHISLVNRSGFILERFSDVTISELVSPDGTKNYFTRMGELFETAVRRYTGADKALDEFMSALEEDRLDDIPF
ncbi:MAG TPA: hypothetical protein VF463_12405 [Sphingobium sp.]